MAVGRFKEAENAALKIRHVAAPCGHAGAKFGGAGCSAIGDGARWRGHFCGNGPVVALWRGIIDEGLGYEGPINVTLCRRLIWALGSVGVLRSSVMPLTFSRNDATPIPLVAVKPGRFGRLGEGAG